MAQIPLHKDLIDGKTHHAKCIILVRYYVSQITAMASDAQGWAEALLVIKG
jgi:hypothetical protein